MLTKISNPRKTHLLTAILVLAALFALPAGPAYAAWPEVEKLLADDGDVNDLFGFSVSISGDYAVVGAWGDDVNGSFSGSAYIFYYNGTNWSQQAKLLAADGDIGDSFGRSVSISGDYTIVGAWGDDDNGSYSGSAYIFKRSGTNWSQQAKLLAADGNDSDFFGWSVSISGDYAIVGAVGDDDNGDVSGSAYIFTPNDVDPNNWDQVAKLLASDGAASDQFGVSVSISGDYAIVGAYYDDESGSAYIFKRDGSVWVEQPKLLASDGAVGDSFGSSVSISGDYAVIGAFGNDDSGDGSGSAYIFKRSGTTWSEQAKLTAADGAADDEFGWSVSISGACAIVGAEQDDDNGTDSGSAYIFKRDGTNWSEQAKLIASDGAAGDEFGLSVSVSGDYAIVGAPYDDDIGSAYIFKSFPEIHGTKWHDIDRDGRFVEDTDEQEQGLPGWRIYIDVSENGQFDAAEPNDITDANGNYVLIAPGPGTYLVAEEAKSCWEQTYPDGNGTYIITLDEVGEVAASYNFGNARPTEIHPSAWEQEEQDKLVASDGADNDWFGNSVSISGDYAIVGASYDDGSFTDSGSAYIFTANEVNCGKWDQTAKLTAADAAADDYFGYSVSISGDYAIVGAYKDDVNGTDSGSAYIFTPNDVNPNNWDQVAKLTASDGAGSDWFGSSVSISGDYAIVGAYKDDDNGSSSGSAYIFERSGTIWSQQAKLTAADGNAFDWFGISVSISGDYAVVGASLNDDNGSASGSAYIFKRDGTSWSQQAKLLADDAAADDRFGISVSISGDYAIVGAWFDDDNGSAYIFKRYGTSWPQQDKLTAADGAASDYFGNSVSISGDYAIVGAYGDADSGFNSGSAYIFKRSGTTWSEQAKWLAADGAAYDRFGYSVSVSGAYAIVGAYTDDDSGTDSGSAYMFGKVLCPSMDGTGDCLVNFEDFAIMAGQWLQGAL